MPIRTRELLDHWKAGAEEFSAGRYWFAHECWERGWRTLAEPDKTYVQGLIQAAGAIHLAEKGRLGPATALARRALEKLPHGERVAAPKIVSPDLPAKLGLFLDALETGLENGLETGEVSAFLKSFKVRAEVLE